MAGRTGDDQRLGFVCRIDCHDIGLRRAAGRAFDAERQLDTAGAQRIVGHEHPVAAVVGLGFAEQLVVGVDVDGLVRPGAAGDHDRAVRLYPDEPERRIRGARRRAGWGTLYRRRLSSGFGTQGRGAGCRRKRSDVRRRHRLGRRRGCCGRPACRRGSCGRRFRRSRGWRCRRHSRGGRCRRRSGRGRNRSGRPGHGHGRHGRLTRG
jgi:hypothetical protein